MGIKGDRLTSDSVLTAGLMTEKLQSIDRISARKMFGGHGLFQEEKILGIINSKGEFYFKVDQSNQTQYEKFNSQSHGKMPYYTVPEEISNNLQSLIEWANLSIAISKK